MPPPTGHRTAPGPSAAHLPCRSKAQELRAGLSSNSLRFLTPGRANGLIAFGSEWAGPMALRGLCSRHFHINPHVLADTTNIENSKWHYAAPPPTGNGPGPEL